MRTLVLQKEIEPLPIQKETSIINDYEGILTSNYKQATKENFFKANPSSVFGIKQRVKSRLYNYTPAIDTILKLSVFAVVLTAIL